MKYIKLYEDINFDDIDYEEEYDDGIEVGDKVIPKGKDNVLRTQYSIVDSKYGYLRGNINSDFILVPYYYSYNTNTIVDEIKYKKDGTKLIRFKGQWPYYVSSYWKKVNINESINFDDIDEEEFNIHTDFIGHEDFYNFLLDNNVLDKYIYNIKKEKKDIIEFLSDNAKRDYITSAFRWYNTKEGSGLWGLLSIKWKKSLK